MAVLLGMEPLTEPAPSARTARRSDGIVSRAQRIATIERSVALTPDNQAKRSTSKKTPAKAGAKKTPAKARGRAGRPATPSHEEIAIHAHEIYEAQGGGDDVANWLQAERELSLQ